MRKLKSYVIIIILIGAFFRGYCTDVVIKYIIEKDSVSHTKHSISDYMLGIINNNWDNVDLNSGQELPSTKEIIFNKSNQEIVIIHDSIKRSGVYFIKDIFGHEIFLDQSMDGDTIVLALNIGLHKKTSSGKEHYYLNDSVSNTKFYKINYPAKYKYMGFFDSLAYLYGDLRGGGGGIHLKN